MKAEMSRVGNVLLRVHSATAVLFCLVALLTKGFSVPLPAAVVQVSFVLPLLGLLAVAAFVLWSKKTARLRRDVFIRWQLFGVLWWLAVMWMAV